MNNSNDSVPSVNGDGQVPTHDSHVEQNREKLFGAWNAQPKPNFEKFFRESQRAFDKMTDAERQSMNIENLRRMEEAALAKEQVKRGLPTDEFMGAAGGPARQLIGRSMAGVQLRAIDWLWTGWIPRKYITLIVGESGAGKSTVLADIVARITTGKPWPGENAARQPGRVLWLGSEDGAEDMTVPRLVACGADLNRVIEIQGVRQGTGRATFSMQDDVHSVKQWLTHARDVDSDPFVMLVIDPITSYLPGRKLRKVDMNDTGQLRSILEPWFDIAQTFNLAIGSVTHFNKDTTRSMLHRVTGSAVFAQTCRSLCAMVGREEDGPFAKAMVQVKTNLPEQPEGAWRFTTVKTQVGTDQENGKPVNATHPQWEELDASITPASLMGGERGPFAKTDYDMTFPLWLRAHFAATDKERGLPITTVMEAAISGNVVSKKWWRENSGRYLDKRNEGGTWMCRPAVLPIGN